MCNNPKMETTNIIAVTINILVGNLITVLNILSSIWDKTEFSSLWFFPIDLALILWSNAGTKVIETTNAIKTPIPASIPKFLNAFIDDIAKEKNPIAVVRDVIKMVILNSLNVSVIAFFLSRPFDSKSSYFDKMWIKFDIPTISIIVGKIVLKTFKGRPNNPSNP